jgi:DNA processing protein
LVDIEIATKIHLEADKDYAKRQLEMADQAKIRIMTYWDSDYPDILKTIPDPPVVLFVNGEFPVPLNRSLAIVGMRKPSAYGKNFAEKLAKALAALDIVVVSGMARGIDTQAHRGALAGAGQTIAVLGCGVNVVYPPENVKLYDQIAASGAVISEFPMNTSPLANHFPRRNRIISGLSLGTVVVEAGQKSGALLTAYMALEQGREVFAVPGQANYIQSKGPHRLIKEGARLIESVDDILEELPQLDESRSGKSVHPAEQIEMTDPERKLFETLSEDPKHVDVVSAESGLSTSEVLAVLLSLELKNAVRQLSGMMYVRQ